MIEYTKKDLLEAKRQIDSTLHKLRETILTLQGKENPARYKSQITLAQRRVKAFEISAVTDLPQNKNVVLFVTNSATFSFFLPP